MGRVAGPCSSGNVVGRRVDRGNHWNERVSRGSLVGGDVGSYRGLLGTPIFEYPSVSSPYRRSGYLCVAAVLGLCDLGPRNRPRVCVAWSMYLRFG